MNQKRKRIDNRAIKKEKREEYFMYGLEEETGK